MCFSLDLKINILLSSLFIFLLPILQYPLHSLRKNIADLNLPSASMCSPVSIILLVAVFKFAFILKNVRAFNLESNGYKIFIGLLVMPFFKNL